MFRSTLSLLLLPAVSALLKMPSGITEETLCDGGLCDDRDLPYSNLIPSQPGYQWNDAGGYCGSWATQRAVLSKGAWISQQQVRDHTSPCGGNDNEILSCNIDEAWTNLKLDYDGFDFKSLETPQTDGYKSWLKAQLAQGNAVAWMILWSGQTYPIYDLTPPSGMYGHVEPVIGIQSNHPLNDTTVYDDDVILHYTDGGVNTVHREMSTLSGEWGGPGEKADCGDYSYCIGNPWGFGWAVKGFADDVVAAPASLHISPWMKEPDTRSGEDPDEIQGTLTATDLEEGATYAIYRWDSVKEALTYSDEYKKTTFKATSDTYEYVDDKSFQSDSATYYRVVKQ
uniref:Phospholipase B-like n=1 Tax=Triparma pacifica TaxID=91992 RepID=A0A7S2QUW5_9STRA